MFISIGCVERSFCELLLADRESDKLAIAVLSLVTTIVRRSAS
jgi:hypothetical protein